MIIYYVKDLLEIIFFSITIYYFSLWLKRDKSYNLLVYFYAYCALFCAASLIHLPTVTAFLLYSSPLILLFFIIMHQEILQRNFISVQKSSITANESDDWLEQLLRASLYAINNNKQIVCVIENQTDLGPFLQTPLIFNSPLQQNIILLLMESSGFDAQKIVWCSATGKLIGINCTWRIATDDVWKSLDVKELPAWQQDALLMTLKTDTILFKADPVKRNFDIIIKGVLHENCSAAHALALIKKYIPAYGLYKKDTVHDHQNKNLGAQQSHH